MCVAVCVNNVVIIATALLLLLSIGSKKVLATTSAVDEIMRVPSLTLR